MLIKYCIYTDGACSKEHNKIASAFFIRTSKQFITLGANMFIGDSAATAETLAIGVGIENLLSEVALSGDDSVRIYTDSTSAIEFFSHISEEKAVPWSKDPRVRLTWKILKSLDDMCKNWKFVKVKAHLKEINGNVIADRLAKHALRKVVN